MARHASTYVQEAIPRASPKLETALIMDFHNSSLALKEWLEATQPEPPAEPERAFLCEARDPKTNELIWDDWIYSRKDRLLRIREAKQDGLNLFIDNVPCEIWS